MNLRRRRNFQVESLESRLPFTVAEAQEFVVMDFEDSALRDASWLASQPGGTVGTYVGAKGDSGVDRLTLAQGQGRDGSNALLVEAPDANAGLPGFWVLRNASAGGSITNSYSDKGYLLPRGARANRLDFWVRFEDGFRATSSATAYQNVNIGTYHFDPAKIGTDKTVETDNWHFYHQLVLRHDKARDGWIHVVVNEIPQHQRGLNQFRVEKNPTGLAGNYWELATRFYVDLHPYFGEPESGYPAKMWVDDIKLSYVPEPDLVDVNIEGWENGQELDARAGETVEMNVTVTNNGPDAIGGMVNHRSRYSYAPKLLDAATRQSVQGQLITLGPGETRNLILSLTSGADTPAGTNSRHSVVFIPASEERVNSHSQADPNVEIDGSVYGFSGPSDASIPSSSMRLVIGESSTNMRPTAQGGEMLTTPPGTTLTGQLPASDPDGQPLTYIVTEKDAVGGALTVDASTGAFTFVPTTGFDGKFRFEYKVNDGVEDSRSVASWIVVRPDTLPRISISNVSVSEGQVGTSGAKKGVAQLTEANFRVTLSRAFAEPVTVYYQTKDGTATTADGDYTAAEGSVTFAPGETTQTVTVIVRGDSKLEANESFFVELSQASDNAAIADQLGLGTITNDDQANGKPAKQVVAKAASAKEVGRHDMKLKDRQDYHVARQNGKGRAMRAAKARGRTDLETYLDAKHEDKELDDRIRVDEDPKHHNEQETELELENENELEQDPLKVTL